MLFIVILLVAHGAGLWLFLPDYCGAACNLTTCLSGEALESQTAAVTLTFPRMEASPQLWA